jgi:hypothetical protein
MVCTSQDIPRGQRAIIGIIGLLKAVENKTRNQKNEERENEPLRFAFDLGILSALKY